MRALLGAALCAASAGACSNWIMNNKYTLSARTMDLGGSIPGWDLRTFPVGLRNSTRGYVGVVPSAAGVRDNFFVFGGLNDAGLSCDLQTLEGTQYPQPSKQGDNIPVGEFCRWALESFASVVEAREAAVKVNFHGPCLAGPAHWVLRDSNGTSLVVEFIGGEMKAYLDYNDAGATGFGVMTNEPSFPWQVEAARHLEWKRKLARPSVAMPGSWYPDERFQRIHLVKSGMKAPASYQEAVMQTVHVLNTVTVPMGDQIGTDSGAGSGEGSGDHTQWGSIYDHLNRVLYWRSQTTQNLQRLRLADAHLSRGSAPTVLSTQSSKLAWFSDAAGAFARA